ncbi:DUF7530 family protein [Natronococcus occultus]|uniref:Uncharacterized protein n=1 Tax=Natronococcus occultus SP4 TaxID=694430 RepID=L0JVS4_9EURY|nr:hypothetical protein [Natronococcus occultus]AGB35958.1 hypothetical protein Natoc_0076 [Natronococcus occultus SP4]
MSRTPEYGETWVYESIVGALPGVELSDRLAIGIQFTVFEGALLAVAAVYGLWDAVVPGTVAVLVAAVGSWLMLRYSRSVRALRSPDGYRRVLFGSNIEVVLGVVSFVLLVTYLFVTDPRTSDQPLLTEILGPEPPSLAVALLLLILWDVVYRIGTCWWATVAGLWRAVVYEFGPETTREYARIDGLNVAFAGVQLLFVPFVLDHPILVAALVGHVIAVVAVATLSVLLQRRSRKESDRSIR